MPDRAGNGAFRVGLLVPSSNTTMEPDFHRTLPGEVEVATSRMYLPETTKQAEIAMIEDSLPEACRMLRTAAPRLTVFGCTSGGALFGREHDRGIARRIGEETGGEVVTILSALSEEFARLGAKKLHVLTPYVDELNAAVRSSLEEDGLEVLSLHGMGITDNLRIGRTGGEEILAFAREKIAPEALGRADCLFISCTNLPAVGALPFLEKHFPGTPIMTSNLAAINAVRRRYEKARTQAA